MALTGRSAVATLLLAVSIFIFVSAFSDAAAGFQYGSWEYGPQVAFVLDNLPVILASLALLLLVKPLERVGGS